MKAVIFNGARESGSAMNAIEESLINLLTEKGWAVDPVELRDKQIAGCLGCFGCWIKTPGTCVIDDYGRETAKKAVQCDLLVWLTPITFGGYSSELKKAVDRQIPNVLPYFESYKGQIHHKMRYEKYPKLLVIGTEPQSANYEETFLALTERNALNLRPPMHATGIFPKDENPEKAPSFVEELLKKIEVIP